MNNKDKTQIILAWFFTAQLTCMFIGWAKTSTNVYRFEKLPEVSAKEEGIESSPSPDAVPEPIYSNDPVVNYIYETFGVEEGKSALKVAMCESSMNPEAESPTSSASGLYQIIDGTWNLFKCTGDPYNAFDNIDCAKKIFDHTGGWNTSGGWLASFSCHQME